MGCRFRGSSDHTIDEKGRFIIPVRFRNVLGELKSEILVVARMDKTLFAYPDSRWCEIEEKINSLAEKTVTMRRFRRVFIGTAVECSWDKQGRILIPPDSRKYAALNKKITLVGVTDHFEIWNREKWKNENVMMEDEDMHEEEVRNEIAKLGL